MIPLVLDLLKGVLEGFGTTLTLLLKLRYFWLFLLLALALKMGPQLYERWRLQKAGMPEIDRMTGLEFEKYLELLFTRLGYQVKRTPYIGDQGGDLVLSKSTERILVQAKRYSKSVGNKAVQEAAAARPHYGCQRAMVVSNQEFTRAAQELARSNQVELWGRRRLAQEILAIQVRPPAVAQSDGPLQPTPIAAAPSQNPAEPLCPRCGRTMVLRQSARGPFWGCPSFPKCRGIVSLQSTPGR